MPSPQAPPPVLPGVEVTRETTRRFIAYVALCGYLALMGGILILGWGFVGANMDDVLKVLTTTAGILSGVVGAVIGFYFQAQQR